jgi:murein DD-endopeptidase MepM/ murein hydrolase activator NlpD
VSRHRSPEGRRAHLEPPLPAGPAAAGVGGVRRTVARPLAVSPSAPVSLRSPTSGPPSALSALTSALISSLPARFVATALAGSALAATGQHLLVQAVPAASGGVAALRTGLDGFPGANPGPATSADVPAGPITAAAASTALRTGPIGAVSPIGADPVVADPVVADAAGLVKAADLQRAAAEDAARTAEAERTRQQARQQALDARDRASQAAEARAAAGGGVQVVNGVFSSPFGTRNGRAHEGVDIAAPVGTPIHVPLDGTVIDAGPASGFGLWVRVRHGDGTITTYGHVNRFFVTVGQRVEAGEVIAEVGDRGESTGPHLHFEVTAPGGTKIDPRPWMAGFGVTV